MSGFGYLVTLVSVVAGLALTHLLFGLARLVHMRGQLRFSGVHFAWTGSTLLWLVSYWWFTFLLIDIDLWTPPLLLFVLAYGAVIYFLIALLYPDQWSPGTDLFEYFLGNRRWFFGTFVGLGVLDLGDTWIKVGIYNIPPPPIWPYILLMVSWIAFGVLGAITSSRAHHKAIAYVWLIVSVSWVFFALSTIGG